MIYLCPSFVEEMMLFVNSPLWYLSSVYGREGWQEEIFKTEGATLWLTTMPRTMNLPDGSLIRGQPLCHNKATLSQPGLPSAEGPQ
jgi:hypothetical protein